MKEKRPLQAGDRVRVYGGVPGTDLYSKDPATVVSIDKNGDVRVKGVFDPGKKIGTWTVERKQLRRLIRKERREWDVVVHKGTGHILGEVHVQQGSWSVAWERIRVREIKP